MMDGISRLTYKQKGPKYFGPFCYFMTLIFYAEIKGLSLKSLPRTWCRGFRYNFANDV
jgi:hypothetical protein